jgi:uncharacterized protein (DUF1501 family)
MNRRDFLGLIAAAPLAANSAKLWAAPTKNPRQPRFLLVFLRGGYDATNLLIPYQNDFYYNSRPHIAVPRVGAQSALPLTQQWGLHPKLQASILPLYRQSQVAFVPFAGTQDMTRSHFETQDHIELGQGAHTQSFSSGFLNRLAGILGARVQSIAFTAQLPLSMRGKVRIPNIALASVNPKQVNGQNDHLIDQMYQGKPLYGSVREGYAVRDQILRDMQTHDSTEGYEAEMLAASRGAPNPNQFAAQAERIGLLLRDQYHLGFVDLGGWDTHVAEVATNGADGVLANRLGELADGLAVLPRVMGSSWQDTVVVVVSEFGRTFHENGNRGTDHGHGSVYWVLGGGLHGGKIAGEQVEISAATLNQNRDWPVFTDYRSLLGGLFQKQFGLNHAELQVIFPQANPLDLQLI